MSLLDLLLDEVEDDVVRQKIPLLYDTLHLNTKTTPGLDLTADKVSSDDVREPVVLRNAGRVGALPHPGWPEKYPILRLGIT